MSDIDGLNERYGVDEKVSFALGAGNLPKIIVQTPKCCGEIYLHGAHVTAFTPAGCEPVLWLSRMSRFRSGIPIRGGIPICFPWFDIHECDPQLPMHGFARRMDWSVSNVEQLPSSSMSISLCLEENEDSLKIWPHRFRLTYSMIFDTFLTVRLAVHNSSSHMISVTEALHSYFTIGDIRSVSISGLEGVDYVDKVSGNNERTRQRGQIRFEGETDRPYLNTQSQCILDDPRLNRRIAISKVGSNTTVVWNPWIDKASKMEDFGDEEWQNMVCIETANALENRITINPGNIHIIESTISIMGRP